MYYIVAVDYYFILFRETIAQLRLRAFLIREEMINIKTATATTTQTYGLPIGKRVVFVIGRPSLVESAYIVIDRQGRT